MANKSIKNNPHNVVVFTGEGKGKTSASLGLLARALGSGQKVAFIQFIKSWQVNEDIFLDKIKPLFKDSLFTYKGGVGFYNAGDISAKNVSKKEHQQIAQQTYSLVLEIVKSGAYNLVICDEINNAVHDGLLTKSDLKKLITSCNTDTSLCLTGRNFPSEFYNLVGIASDITKIKHHYDEGYQAIKGIDY